nr:hypothetical protein [Brucella anthropi]DAM62859.1 MAG TPA: hypothetical protein [Caudoviricetes sp.]
MSNHYNACLQSVLNYANSLGDAVRKKRLNASACERLIRSFLDQPAYYPEWRRQLLEEALKEIGEPNVQ